MNPIHIIGLGQGRKDLTSFHLDLIQDCDILVAGKRMLDMFPDTKAETITIRSQINKLILDLEIKAKSKKIVVLASGDPLFYGIGSTFCRLVDKEKFIIHSNINSVAAAFAAIKEPWHDAEIISLHGTHDSFPFFKLKGKQKIAFLTDPVQTPETIAQQLSAEGLFNYRVCVLECLGDLEKQRISWFDSVDLVPGNNFTEPNMVILVKKGSVKKQGNVETHTGMDDVLFKHSKGLITKSEIRSISLSKLKLTSTNHVFWDIGSGSGSVGIEASFLLPYGHVYAIEKNAVRIPDIIKNISNFNCSNVKVIHADYPDGLPDDIKQPNRIFIGGGGKHIGNILTDACQRLSRFGIIVVNTVLLENLETTISTLNDHHFHPEVVQIQVSRGKKMPFGTRFEALNPVWIISGTKPDERNTK